MKIVSVMTTASAGGAEFAAVALLDVLSDLGHETVMLSNQRGIVRDTRVREVALELGPKLSRRSWPALAATAPLRLARLRRALTREAPYDVLLLHFKKEQLLALGLPRPLLPRVAWAEWGPVPAPLRAGPGGWLYRRAARGAAAVLAVSEGTRRSVIEAGVDAAKVHVVPNAVSAEEMRPRPQEGAAIRAELGIPPGAFAIGCLSRFHPKKRNDVAVAAALALRADPGAPPVHLVLAGEGETEAQLRAQAAPLGPAAHFVPTPGPRTAALLSACDVTVFCPSPTEGAPLAVIMAMLCECPCVATGAEGVTDLLPPGTGAIAQPDNDPRAVAALLRGYRDDAERRRREGAAARRHAAALHDAESVGRRAERLLGPG